MPWEMTPNTTQTGGLVSAATWNQGVTSGTYWGNDTGTSGGWTFESDRTYTAPYVGPTPLPYAPPEPIVIPPGEFIYPGTWPWDVVASDVVLVPWSEILDLVSDEVEIESEPEHPHHVRRIRR